jgi:N-acyl-D-amino-acid deacylase
VLAGARIVDGSGAPAFVGDIGIRAGRIVALGDLSKTPTDRSLDVHERVAAPGFIDMLGQSEWSVLADGRAASKPQQGITTELTGEPASVAPMEGAAAEARAEALLPLGIHIDWTDLNGYFRRFLATGSTIHLGSYVGAAQVRVAVLGMGDVQPTDIQLTRMRSLVEREMSEGAFGLSTALEYAPGTYTTTKEIVALAEVASRYSGVYATHLRDQGDHVLDAIEEAIGIGRLAHVPMQIWHLKVMGRHNWGRMRAVLDRLERARAEGVDVRASIYPYTASANGFDYYLPSWVEEGSVETMLARLQDPTTRARIAQEMDRGSLVAHDPADIEFIGPATVATRAWMGKRLLEIAGRTNKSPAEAIVDIVAETHNEAMAIEFSASEDDLQLAMQAPWITFDTDYAASALDGPLSKTTAHPRAFGTTARVLGHYVRELHTLSLEQAVRRLSGLPAAQLRLDDRGLIKPGRRADLVVFDPVKVGDESSYEQPNRYPTGIDYVIVGGQVVLDHGTVRAARPGEPLRRLPAASASP